MGISEGNIGSCRVTISPGDMTTRSADAYVVPQFRSCTSFGGVAGAIARSGAMSGLEAYGSILGSQGPQPFGKAVITASGGGSAKRLIHVVSVDSDVNEEFEIVSLAFYNALKVAERNGLGSVVAPAMGTGVLGRLTGEQSALATMSAIDRYAAEGGSPLDIEFVIFSDQQALSAFADVFATGAYRSTGPGPGQRHFDHQRWDGTMTSDTAALNAAMSNLSRSDAGRNNSYLN